MPKYIVKSPVKSGGKIRAIGDVIELDELVAAPLLAARNVEVHDPKVVFQDSVAKAEAAARELEAAGGDPSAAHRELQQHREQEEADARARSTESRGPADNKIDAKPEKKKK